MILENRGRQAHAIDAFDINPPSRLDLTQGHFIVRIFNRLPTESVFDTGSFYCEDIQPTSYRVSF